ncbi:M12 family metallo-peptidase [Chryseobacterium sp. CT-SW4]|uniref:M12 family metallo-peptidase n=1 Tax=Chryseobacterium sp. SW-1 TaxID=3157343 RepID=UPI003B01EA96
MKNYLILLFCLLGTCLWAQKIINLNDENSKYSLQSTRQNIPQEYLENVKSSRVFTVNKALKNKQGTQVGDVITLQLFEGKSYNARISNKTTDRNGTLVITAKLLDYPMGYCLISTTKDNKSLLYVEIPELNEKYVSRTGTDKNSEILLELDNKATGELPCDELTPPAPKKSSSPVQQITQKGVNDHAQIDVMIVYTPAAKAWSDQNEGGINNTIAGIMSKADLVLNNSNVTMDVNLVYSGLVNYVESGSSSTDLSRITNTSDGYMDQVHQWRDQYSADLVVLLTNVQDTGGLAWLLNTTAGNPAYGFSISRVQQASWSYTTIHEMGHNMGMGHHKQQKTQAGPGLFSYSAGWRWAGNDSKMYCSVMTYEAASYFNDGLASARVPYFSNPSLQYAGYPTGNTTEADGARTLRETKHAVAAYRNSCRENFEPNEEMAAAYPINLNTEYMAAIGNANDSDWYTFNMDQSEGALITFSNLPPGYTLWFYFSSGYLASSATSNENGVATINYNSGLAQGTYYMRLFAHSGKYVEPSGCYTVKVETGPRCYKISNLTASAISNGKSTLSWTAAYANAIGYAVKYQAIKTGSSEITAVANTTSTSATITGLDATQNYTVRVYTNCATNQSGSVSTSIGPYYSTPLEYSVNSTTRLYPNPVKDILKISSDKAIREVSIYDLTGKEVKKEVSANIREINVQELTPGVYVVKTLTDDSEVLTSKIIKQ